MNLEDKKLLDSLMVKYKAQSVGSGYLEIITKRENYRDFIDAVLENGFKITRVSWWEYCETMETRNNYGMGGPRSKFYTGWFSELCMDWDNIASPNNLDAMKHEITKTIENKTIEIYNGEVITYRDCLSLTPAFEIKVPDTWKNEQ